MPNLVSIFSASIPGVASKVNLDQPRGPRPNLVSFSPHIPNDGRSGNPIPPSPLSSFSPVNIKKAHFEIQGQDPLDLFSMFDK